MSRSEKRHSQQYADKATIQQFFKQEVKISTDQINAILEKHRLGCVQSLQRLTTNPMNSVFSITSAHREALILKIQHHSGIGSLAAESHVSKQLRQSSDLPVSHLCVFDAAADILPYPYLLLNQLPGIPGRDFFENTHHLGRMQLSSQLGHIVGIIHSQKVTGLKHLRNHDLNQWHQILENTLFGDEGLEKEIALIDGRFYSRLNHLMTTVAIPHIDEQLVLNWGDAVFHNLLVKENGKRLQVTGIYDFQFASYGCRIFDLLHAEGDFSRSPREIYGHPEYVKQVYCAYSQTVNADVIFDDTQRILRQIINYAGQIRYWWWDCGQIIHPQTPDLLGGILAGLEKSSRCQT